MTAEQVELYFHAAEILLIVLGLVVPVWLGYLELRTILRNFPPHLHRQDGSIVYPKGFEPPREQQLFSSAKAGK
jgi:hypothetical protein